MLDHRETSKYDHTVIRSAVRYGRQRGITVFIPAAELRKAGIDPAGPPPGYKLAGTNVRGRRVIVNLYPR